MNLASVVLASALAACAATLCIGGWRLAWSSRRAPFSRGAIVLSIVIGALAVMIPVTARSGLEAPSPAAPIGGIVPTVLCVPGEMGRSDDHRGDAALPNVGATGQPEWSLIAERAERLRSQGDYSKAADAYAEVLVSAGGNLAARLSLAKVLLEFGRFQEAELHVGRATAIACRGAGSPPDLVSAFSAVEEIREEFASRLSKPLTTIQRQRLTASKKARLTAIWKGSPWRVTVNVTDVREVRGELVVEGTLTTDPALSIRVQSGDRSHVRRRIDEQLEMTIVLTHWPLGREAFDGREFHHVEYGSGSIGRKAKTDEVKSGTDDLRLAGSGR